MNAFGVSVVCLTMLFLAYRFYSRYLAKKVFSSLKKDGEMPSASQNDGIDYVPTNRSILFGHHFSSVAGAAPILGPAIAIIWGWLPALIWIVFGSIFIGAVHDFGALFLSALFDGKSIGSITGDILGRNARLLFLIIIFILVFEFSFGFSLTVRDYIYLTVFNTYQLQVFNICIGDYNLNN